MQYIVWGEITNPFSNFNGCTVDLSSHILLDMWLFIHAGIKVKPYLQIQPAPNEFI